MGIVQYTDLSAYAHPSTYSGFNDSHTFVKASTGETYSNYGGVYPTDITLTANGLAYRTWLNAFMPNQTTDFTETGISFSANGVCHTYAMRELLLCVNKKDVSLAAGDDLCLLYYGKYGCGLRYLEQRLRESFAEARKTDDLPTEVLNRTIARIYDTLDEEVEAWIKALKAYLQIDVISLFRSPNDWIYLRDRVKRLIDAREKLFEECFNSSNRSLSGDFRSRKKDLYLREFHEYVTYLARIGYFSNQQAEEFYRKFETILNRHGAYYLAMAQQLHAL